MLFYCYFYDDHKVAKLFSFVLLKMPLLLLFALFLLLLVVVMVIMT